MPGAQLAVGLCHRALACVSEFRGLMDESLAHREESLRLLSQANDPTDHEVMFAFWTPSRAFSVGSQGLTPNGFGRSGWRWTWWRARTYRAGTGASPSPSMSTLWNSHPTHLPSANFAHRQCLVSQDDGFRVQDDSQPSLRGGSRGNGEASGDGALLSPTRLRDVPQPSYCSR